MYIKKLHHLSEEIPLDDLATLRSRTCHTRWCPCVNSGMLLSDTVMDCHHNISHPSSVHDDDDDDDRINAINVK